MKWMMSIALLASVAAPALAQNGPPQGWHHGGGEGRGGEGYGGDGRGGPRPGLAPQPQPQQQPPHQQFQPRPAPDQGGRPPFQPRGGEGRGVGGPGHGPEGVQLHRGDYRPDRPDQGRPDWQGGRPGSDGRPGGDGRPGWQGGRPGGDRPDNRPGRPDWQDGRPDHGHDGRPDGRPDWNNGRPGGWDGNRPGHGGRPGPDPRPGWDHGRPGGTWNRGWRDDHRYDWHGWRDTHRSFYHVGTYRPPHGYGWGYRRFSIGVAIDPVFFAQDYWISDPWYYRLPPADGPYRWVRYYNDALLIDVYSGTVVDAIPDFFW